MKITSARPVSPLSAVLTVLVFLAAADGGLAQQGIAVTMTDELDFGRIVATGLAGAVAVTVEGERIPSGGVHLGGGAGTGAARFNVTGQANASYSITLPESEQLWFGDASMTVDAFLSTPSDAGNLGAAGTQVVAVGATLRVHEHQAPGAYSGTYTVTVAYE